MCLWKLQSTTYIWIEPFCGWNKWWCLVDLQPLYPHQSKTMYNVTLISHTHAATIPSPIKKTSCPPFPPEDQNYKQECLPLNNPSPHLSFCPMVFSWAPSNYLFKRHTKGRIITIPKYCLVLELALGLLPPYFHLSYLLYTSISTSLSHHLSFFFLLFTSGFCRCVFAVWETSASTVSHLYSSIAISPPLWCLLGMPDGR